MKSEASSLFNSTLLGIVFDAGDLTDDSPDMRTQKALIRAWQIWMGRLDSQELRGAALYDGPWQFKGGRLGVVVAISGSPQVIRYVHAAFSAPDLNSFPGMAPSNQRFVFEDELPREHIHIRGYLSQEGAWLAQDPTSPLNAVAQQAGWQVQSLPVNPPPSRPIVQQPPVPLNSDVTAVETQMMKTVEVEGATQVMLRLWKSSFDPKRANADRRRMIVGLVGVALILISIGFIGLRVMAKDNGNTQSPPVHQASMVVTPLQLNAPCEPGQTSEFTVHNNGDVPLNWSSNGALFSPILSFITLSGTVEPNGTQTVYFTTTQYLTIPSTDTLDITSNGGTAHMQITVGACQPTPGQM
jgi:hypothetical protein